MLMYGYKEIYNTFKWYSFYLAENALEQNQVAGFLTLLKNFVSSSPVNQDSLVRTNAIATLGALLQKVCLNNV